MDRSSSLILTFLVLLLTPTAKHYVFGATFTFVNRCDYTVWPGILANAGSPTLDSTGFELPKDSSRALVAPTGWSGRFWARTGCAFGESGSGSCLTGDCGSGAVECNGAGAAPPATLAEFTLGAGGGQDFYDVSLVDGYNVAMVVEGSGGAGLCTPTGCAADLNGRCPAELRAAGGGACRSACEAFGTPEYCCSGAYGSPTTCRPSVYSEMFKSACPRSYSYAYDDATSTFTCTGADYTITFCPSSPSQKSSRDTTTPSTTPQQQQQQQQQQGSVSDSGLTYSDMGSGSQPGFTYSDSGSGSGYVPGSGSREAILPDGSWLAGLAMGDSPRPLTPSLVASAALSVFIVVLSFRKL